MRLLNLAKYNSASEMFVSFGEQLQKSVFSFRNRIFNSDNSLVHSIVNSVAPLFSKNMSLVERSFYHILCAYIYMY